jgi:mono/diheme cytochrome c family protein
MRIAKGATMNATKPLGNRKARAGSEPDRLGAGLRHLIGAACAAFLFRGASGFSGPAVSAGDPVAGQTSYLANCTACHGVSPSHLVLSGANAPDVIQGHMVDLWETRGLRLSASATDIAAYLGTLLNDEVNYEGLWWNSPGGSEPGWGLNIAHQGDVIFATWFTYDLSGKGIWFVMTAPKSAPGTYNGALYTATGPSFAAASFDPTQVLPTPVGSATLSFTDADNGSFAYNVNGISRVKAITRQVFGQAPSCAIARGSLAMATNYQDLWWGSPAGTESGWGINLTHQGYTLFATWFTYDVDHTPMWLAVTAPMTGDQVYEGTLYRTVGPAFNAPAFDSSAVVATAVGTARFTFANGNNASFTYVVSGVSQTKAITRQVFQSPGTVCSELPL